MKGCRSQDKTKQKSQTILQKEYPNSKMDYHQPMALFFRGEIAVFEFFFSTGFVTWTGRVGLF